MEGNIDQTVYLYIISTLPPLCVGGWAGGLAGGWAGGLAGGWASGRMGGWASGLASWRVDSR